MIIHLGDNQYTKFSYPAHEIQVRLGKEALEALAVSIDPVTIVARDLDPSRLMELALLRDALGGIHGGLERQVNLVIPYLPYSRADRRFVYGDCHGLATMGKLLFGMSFRLIVTLDVHSEEAIAYIPELVRVSPEPLISLAINDYAKFRGAHRLNLLYPDEGASKRYQLRDNYGCNTYLIETSSVFCWKKRDAATGVMLGFEVPDLGEIQEAPILIIDDICDGGATFIGIAEALRGKGITAPLALYVTHGIFSKGMAVLEQYFEKIYTSNSFTHGTIDRFDAVPLLIQGALR